ncbi:MAG: AarF/UbiB family protein [Verrucomicrobiota bacterium JB022]|nr:AarF/UbiB family protein [Verrucomicrobiota bacterium JB022]
MTSFRPAYLRQYLQLFRLLARHGRAPLKREHVTDEPPESPEKFARDLEDLGPTYVKLGQLLSTRPELLAPAYREALARLQDKVKPISIEEVESVIEAELGSPPGAIFSEFCKEPLGSGSLAQVHAARLPSGEDVVVKVQRPNIRQQILRDLSGMELVAEQVDAHTSWGERYHFADLIREFRHHLQVELDFSVEARAQKHLRESINQFRNLYVPWTVDRLCTERVLVMERVNGVKVSKLDERDRLRLPGEEMIQDLFHAYLRQVLMHGYFHADPHPGNLLLTTQGRLCILDFGLCARFSPDLQENMLQFLLALSEGRGKDTCQMALKIGQAGPAFDRFSFEHDVSRIVLSQREASVAMQSMGETVFALIRACAEHYVRLPAEINLLGKTLMNLDLAALRLHPEFQPAQAVRKYATEAVSSKLKETLSVPRVLQNSLEWKDLLEQTPSRLNRLLNTLSDNRIGLKVDAIDENFLMEGFQKIANRITIGIILAAVIIGAALLMRVETSFSLFGYPGLAIIFFLGAAIGGFSLIVEILVRDRKKSKRQL